MRVVTISKILVIKFTLIISFNAAAINCSDQSANYKKDADAYYVIDDAEPLTKNQQADIDKFFSSIVKKTINGKGVITHCVGAEKTALKKVEYETVRLKTKQDLDGRVVLDFRSKIKGDKSVKNEKIRLFGSHNSHFIDELTGKSLIINSKLRKRVGYRKNAVINEEVIKITLLGKTLVIEVTRYVGGLFGVNHVRTFKL